MIKVLAVQFSLCMTFKSVKDNTSNFHPLIELNLQQGFGKRIFIEFSDAIQPIKFDMTILNCSSFS